VVRLRLETPKLRHFAVTRHGIKTYGRPAKKMVFGCSGQTDTWAWTAVIGCQ
jgi:hypothetical protein